MLSNHHDNRRGPTAYGNNWMRIRKLFDAQRKGLSMRIKTAD
jgi:hypothetical protein